MAEEIEVPLEKLSDDIQEHGLHARERWVGRVALTAAILAVLAAIAALLGGHHANEATIERIKASDHWGYYQAKGIKAAILSSRDEVFKALDKKVPERDTEKLADYAKEQEEISVEARAEERSADHHLDLHHIFARSVTFFQVAIAVSAIAVLVHRRRYWALSLAFGLVGVLFLLQGLIS